MSTGARRAYVAGDRITANCQGDICGNETCTGHEAVVVLVFPCGDFAVQAGDWIAERGPDDVTPLESAP